MFLLTYVWLVGWLNLFPEWNLLVYYACTAKIGRQVILIPDLFWNLCGGGEVLIIVYGEGP